MITLSTQVGTVIESTSEYYSSRLSKKERKSTLADELLHDDKLKAYRYETRTLFYNC